MKKKSACQLDGKNEFEQVYKPTLKKLPTTKSATNKKSSKKK